MKWGEGHSFFMEENQLSFCRLVYAVFGLIDALSLIDFAGRHIRCVSSLNVT